MIQPETLSFIGAQPTAEEAHAIAVALGAPPTHARHPESRDHSKWRTAARQQILEE
ncbi:MAG: hypothetical protein ACREMP_10165 [Candidatus Tyrphobacter sp.]